MSDHFVIEHHTGSVMEVHHPVFYLSLGHMQNRLTSQNVPKPKRPLVAFKYVTLNFHWQIDTNICVCVVTLLACLAVLVSLVHM